MIVWLDHLIFGNGHGLKSPWCDSRFYWLSGEFYTWSGWFGAQLQSFQWRHPKPGEERVLNKRTYRPFHSYRQWLWLFRNAWVPIPLPIGRVCVAWSTHLPESIADANIELHTIIKELNAI